MDLFNTYSEEVQKKADDIFRYHPLFLFDFLEMSVVLVGCVFIAVSVALSTISITPITFSH